LMSVGLESQPVLCPNIRFKTLPKPSGAIDWSSTRG
jgi:hypothetical protein